MFEGPEVTKAEVNSHILRDVTRKIDALVQDDSFRWPYHLTDEEVEELANTLMKRFNA